MTLLRSPRLCLPLALALFAGCDIAGCDQEPPPRSGQLDRLGDIVLLTPPETAGDRSFVVVTNPEVQQLRVFDVLERRFVPAPNLFFPLSARTGPATRRLAASPADQRFVYALDGGADLVQVIGMLPTVEIDDDSVAPAFTTEAVFETSRAPADIAVWSSGEEGELPLAFLTLPDASAVEVLALDLEAETVVDSLLLDLGEGSVPNRLEVDPTGDAVVVTDAALDSVAIVRIRPDDVAGAPLASLDRRVDVGGPTSELAIGRVNPGDGLAPVALVALRDQARLAALRLFRPGFREDRYAHLGSVEIPDLGAALYVPDQLREQPRACCPVLRSQQADDDDPEPATLAWASVTTANGFLYYLRFDAPRAGGGRLVRLIDFGTSRPGVTDELDDDIWVPVEGGENRRPTVEVSAVDNFGDPPVYPLLRSEDPSTSELLIRLVYEGSPPGTANRRGELTDTGDGFAFEVVPGGVPFAERDVEVGDEIVVDTSDRGGSCPATVRMTVEGVSGDTVLVSGLGSGAAACVSQGGVVRFTLFAVGDFLVSTTWAGYQGRLSVGPEPTSLAVPSFVVAVRQSSAGPPLRGSELRIEVTQDLNPVSVPLSRDFLQGGLGGSALFAQGMVGGPVLLRDVEGQVTEGTRMFIATGTGSLLLLEEGTVAVEAVARFE